MSAIHINFDVTRNFNENNLKLIFNQTQLFQRFVFSYGSSIMEQFKTRFKGLDIFILFQAKTTPLYTAMIYHTKSD